VESVTELWERQEPAVECRVVIEWGGAEIEREKERDRCGQREREKDVGTEIWREIGGDRDREKER